jgi:drug/metabolite transporter (DMT)-like permease
MSLPVMIIVLCAALLHACWNFLVKHNADKHLSMSAVVLGHTPFAVIALLFAPLPRIESLPYIFRRGGAACGLSTFLAYAMVTWAFTVAPIPLVTALREASIVFALLLGVFVLKEGLDLTKVLSTLCTMLGIGLLRVNR